MLDLPSLDEQCFLNMRIDIKLLVVSFLIRDKKAIQRCIHTILSMTSGDDIIINLIMCICFHMHYLEVPHDVTAVDSTLEKWLFINTRDITLKVFSCLCKVLSVCITGLKKCTIQDLSGLQKRWQLIPEMLSTMDDWLRTNNEVTASKLKAKLLEWCTSFPDVDLSITIKMLGIHCTSVMLSYGL